jgi:hypothetical protein
VTVSPVTIAQPRVPPLSREPLSFLHAAAQLSAVNLLDTRVRAWAPVLESALIFMRDAMAAEQQRAADLRKFARMAEGWVLGKDNKAVPEISTS